MILNWKYQRVVYMHILAVHNTVTCYDCSNEKIYSKFLFGWSVLVLFLKRGKTQYEQQNLKFFVASQSHETPISMLEELEKTSWDLMDDTCSQESQTRLNFWSPLLRYYTIHSYNSLSCLQLQGLKWRKLKRTRRKKTTQTRQQIGLRNCLLSLKL